MDEADVGVRLVTHTIPNRESFKYLGSIIQGSGDIDYDVTYHIRAEWMKRTLATIILCDKKKMHDIKMRMLRWMYSHTRSNKIINEVIREKEGAASVPEKIRETILGWFGHVMKRSTDSPIGRYERLVIGGT
ncbi:hypothetical protein R3W88_011679 [Solanum pinnatisectum]|uniref:Uncharacterized protein n=1 Tax=Solanum pinnatisectum TaxID=50273 RepID=A0AAV9L6Z3_9SOLN|nr:hypothetical protein R3W88_011679 [Solanum pinnatisectum]